jgi:uncharacterized protein YndB with AHSA1/START domain
MMTDEPAKDRAAGDATGEGTRSAGGEITIDASPERVWRALTDARELERWFPLDARVESGEGGTIWMSWRNEFASDMKILIWEPPRHLRTAWSFHEGELPAQVTDYTLESEGGKTVLRVVTSGFPLDPSWDGWVEGTNRGWAFELRSLKHYLERHEGQPRHVAYLRRRVPLPVQVAWSRIEDSDELASLLGAGEPFDRRSGGQYAAVMPTTDDLFRLSIEPGAPGVELNEVVVFLSAWGDHASRIEVTRSDLSARLDRLFPEGTIP